MTHTHINVCVEAVKYMEMNIIYQHATAIHWSAAQITLGAIDINCSNSSERIFDVLCLFCGLLFGSTLISSLSATMVEFQVAQKKKVQSLRALRKYLRKYCVPAQFCGRVQQQVAGRWEDSKQAASEVPAFASRCFLAGLNTHTVQLRAQFL